MEKPTIWYIIASKTVHIEMDARHGLEIDTRHGLEIENWIGLVSECSMQSVLYQLYCFLVYVSNKLCIS
jgi:hypothetical protein